eukprot:358645-Chlamydomonas_euryale.AAC.8
MRAAAMPTASHTQNPTVHLITVAGINSTQVPFWLQVLSANVGFTTQLQSLKARNALTHAYRQELTLGLSGGGPQPRSMFVWNRVNVPQVSAICGALARPAAVHSRRRT